VTSDVLLAAAEGQPTVRAALDRHLAERGDVYTDPAAFQRFIDGGGNEALYREADVALREGHGRRQPRRALDVGCGDGRLTSALLGPRLEHLDLVEPSANLLDAAIARLTGAGAQVVPHRMTAEQFVDAATDGPWDVAQSTFALHALAPDARRSVLTALAPAVRHLVVIEFDVPAFEDRSPAHAAYAVERYAAGIAEYAHDDLVVQGFLMPVLLGQFDPTQPRHTWEQPIDAWVSDLTAAGFHDVHHRHIHDYWWAPAHIIDASGG
jgi:SAM-dependent methyltransferase